MCGQQITLACWHTSVIVHSRSQFAALAANFGLRPGFAIDLATGLDLTQEEHVQELEKLVEEQDPYLLTGSPPCDSLSVLLNVSASTKGRVQWASQPL